MLPSAPCSRPPQPPVRPSLPSAPASLPPRAHFRTIYPNPVRPILPSALWMLPSAPASRPPHAPFRPSLPSASGCPWMFTGQPRCAQLLSPDPDSEPESRLERRFNKLTHSVGSAVATLGSSYDTHNGLAPFYQASKDLEGSRYTTYYSSDPPLLQHLSCMNLP